MSKSELARPSREVVHYERRLTAVERPIPAPEPRRPPRSVLLEAAKGAACVLAGLLLLYLLAGALGVSLWPWA